MIFFIISYVFSTVSYECLYCCLRVVHCVLLVCALLRMFSKLVPYGVLHCFVWFIFVIEMFESPLFIMTFCMVSYMLSIVSYVCLNCLFLVSLVCLMMFLIVSAEFSSVSYDVSLCFYGVSTVSDERLHCVLCFLNCVVRLS